MWLRGAGLARSRARSKQWRARTRDERAIFCLTDDKDADRAFVVQRIAGKATAGQHLFRGSTSSRRVILGPAASGGGGATGVNAPAGADTGNTENGFVPLLLIWHTSIRAFGTS